MVVIRLARGGCKHNPKYRIAVADKKRAATGRYIEIIGQFNPSPKGQDKEINIDIDRAQYWISKGAQPSRTVSSIIKKAQSGA